LGGECKEQEKWSERGRRSERVHHREHRGAQRKRRNEWREKEIEIGKWKRERREKKKRKKITQRC